jgi:hypothetical protein
MPGDEQKGRAKAPEEASRKWRFWRIVALVFSIYVVEQSVEAIMLHLGVQPGQGYLGASNYNFTITPAFAPGFVTVDRINPDSPLGRAGVSAGDHIRFDRVWDHMRHISAGETLGFTLDHHGARSHHAVTAIAPPPGPQADVLTNLTYDVLTLATCLFGLFVIWRSEGRRTALLLGVSLLLFGLNDSFPQLWEENPRLIGFIAPINEAVFLLIFLSFLAFAISYAADCGVRLGWVKYPYLAYAAVFFAVGAGEAIAQSFGDPILPVARATLALMTYPLYALSMAYMIAGWRRSDASNRQRSSVMLLGFTVLIASQVLVGVVSLVLGAADFASNPFEILSEVLAGIVAPALLSYAILRHRVFDLGFAVNRTLVYSAVSALLLGAFGLAEWLVDHLAPIAGREKIDAGIALVVFLTFHRVRDAVEHGVEALFFRRWQRAEADLRRFVREAGFVTEPQALSEAFVQALGRFGEGASAGIYLDDGQGYDRVAGDVVGLAAHLDVNLPALVSLRAELKPVDIQDGAFTGCLMAPMVIRNAMSGVAVLGPKPAAQGWRPDEIELVGWATRQIGLDLHALTIERLEKERSDLRLANAQLERMVGLAPSRA